MRKKTRMKATVTFTLFVLASVMTLSVEAPMANPIWIVTGIPQIKLLSPQPTAYCEDSVLLSFYGKRVDWGVVEFSDVKVWLDGELRGKLNSALKQAETFSLNLTELEDGKHTLEVTARVIVKSLIPMAGTGITAEVAWGGSAETTSGRLNFTIDANAPILSMLSPQNKLFDTVDIPLNFTVSESVSDLFYSLDGEGNVTITEQVVKTQAYGKNNYYFLLNDLGEGSHSLEIYAKDNAGHIGKTDNYYFTVNTQPTPSPSTFPSPSLTTEPTPEPSLTPSPISDSGQTADLTPAILVVILATAVAISVLVYFRRRKP